MFSLNGGAYQVSGTFTILQQVLIRFQLWMLGLCTANVPVTITEPAAPISWRNADATCPGEADGSITLTITGGTQPYSVIWSDGILLTDRTGYS